jgi:hypothetical protein
MSDPVVERLWELLRVAEKGDLGSWSDLQRWREEALGLLRTLLPTDHDRMESFAGYPTHSTYQRNRGYVPRGMPSESEELSKKVDTLASILGGILTEVGARSLAAPQPDTSGLYPWVSGVIVGLWNDGHHRLAVDEATRAVELRLKAKIARQDLSGVPLVTAAFNPDDPRPGEPRLRFLEYDRLQDPRGWNNAHLGAMHFAQGCMMRIRNLFEHHEGEPGEQIALECLSALSLLSRWIEEAVVEQAPP